MQYSLLGIFFIFIGLSALIFKKYPSMTKYYSSLEYRYNINKKHMLWLDGTFYILSGILFIIAGTFFSNDSNFSELWLIVIFVFLITLYFVLRKKLLTKK